MRRKNISRDLFFAYTDAVFLTSYKICKCVKAVVIVVCLFLLKKKVLRKRVPKAHLKPYLLKINEPINNKTPRASDSTLQLCLPGQRSARVE